MGDVRFDGCGLHTSCERSDPGQESVPGCREDGAIGVEDIVEVTETGVAFLTRRVRRAGGGGDTVE